MDYKLLSLLRKDGRTPRRFALQGNASLFGGSLDSGPAKVCYGGNLISRLVLLKMGNNDVLFVCCEFFHSHKFRLGVIKRMMVT
jgi:hypothetical protein